MKIWKIFVLHNSTYYNYYSLLQPTNTTAATTTTALTLTATIAVKTICINCILIMDL